MNIHRRALLGTVPAFLIPLTALARVTGGAVSLSAPSSARPRIVLLERNPWLMVIGSDSPTFALYEDGTAIYLRETGYKSVTLSEAEMVALSASLEMTKLASLAKYYQATRATDQTTEVIAMFDGDNPAIISVYGSLDSPEVRKAVPAEVSAAYDRLKSFSRPDATDWLPEKIEVMLSPYEYAPDKSITWPKDWPGLESADTVKRRESQYSIFVPKAQFAELKRFLASRREKGAVEIGGKKWFADWRFPFPGERAWMGGA